MEKLNQPDNRLTTLLLLGSIGALALGVAALMPELIERNTMNTTIDGKARELISSEEQV